MVGFRSLKCSNMVGFRALQCSNSATGSTSLSRANPAGRPCRACNILLLIDNSSQGFNQVRALLFNRSVARFSAFLKCVRYYRALTCSDRVVFRALKCFNIFQDMYQIKKMGFLWDTLQNNRDDSTTTKQSPAFPICLDQSQGILINLCCEVSQYTF